MRPGTRSIGMYHDLFAIMSLAVLMMVLTREVMKQFLSAKAQVQAGAACRHAAIQNVCQKHPSSCTSFMIVDTYLCR